MEKTVNICCRRKFISNVSLLGLGVVCNSFYQMQANTLYYDHFLLGCASLEAGIQFIKERTGVEAIKGGKHPGIGTHNALISLANNTYLEIIAPDPEANSLLPDYVFLKELTTPQLFYWAMRTEDIDELVKQIKKAGFAHSGINPGSRQRTDGSVLKWRSLSVDASTQAGVVPFFIEWDKSSRHPSLDSPAGCSILSFEIVYPEPDTLKKIFTQLTIDVPVKYGSEASLLLKIKSPKGIVEL